MSLSATQSQTKNRAPMIGDGILTQVGGSQFAISIEGFIESRENPIAVISVMKVYELADMPGRFHASSPPDRSQFFQMPLSEVKRMFQDSTEQGTVKPLFDIQRLSDAENYPRFEIAG